MRTRNEQVQHSLDELGAEALAGSGFESEQPDAEFDGGAPETAKEEEES
jgi:hypothetical protein